MKKVTVVLLIMVLFLAFSEGVFAFENEPEGFRGLKWGDPVIEDMQYVGPVRGGRGYTLPKDKMSIGNAKFYMIMYLFYEGRFQGVFLNFRGENNYDLLEMICKERYGEAELGGFYNFVWLGQKSAITLSYDLIEEDGFLLMISAVLGLEAWVAEKKKEVEKAEGDW